MIEERDIIPTYLRETLENVYEIFKDLIYSYNKNRSNIIEIQYLISDVNYMIEIINRYNIWRQIELTNLDDLSEQERSLVERLLELQVDINFLINYLERNFSVAQDMPISLRRLPTTVDEYFQLRDAQNLEPGLFIAHYNGIHLDVESGSQTDTTNSSVPIDYSRFNLIDEFNNEATPPRRGQRRGREDEQLPPSRRPRGGAIGDDDEDADKTTLSSLFPYESESSIESSSSTIPFSLYLTNRRRQELINRDRQELINRDFDEMDRFGEFLSDSEGSASLGSVDMNRVFLPIERERDLERDLEIINANVNLMRNPRPNILRPNILRPTLLQGNVDPRPPVVRRPIVGILRNMEFDEDPEEPPRQYLRQGTLAGRAPAVRRPRADSISSLSSNESIRRPVAQRRRLNEELDDEELQEIRRREEEDRRPRGGAIKSRMIVSIGKSNTCYPYYK
jgi:hypothetical protein